jgi:phosphate transport system permease protein
MTALPILTGRRLPRWSTPMVATVAVVLGLLLQFGGISLLGLAPAVVAALTFIIARSAWSWVIEGRRHATDRLMGSLITGALLLALVPLVWILLTVAVRGYAVMNVEFLTGTMRNIGPRIEGGGIGHAFVGTLQQVGIAALISIPVGILTAIQLVEYGRGHVLTRWISFFVDVMTGVPSIVAGLFIYTAVILTLGFSQSGFAAGLALTILMIPVVVRSTEEMLRIVPNSLREGALALGIPKWRVIIFVVLPTAISGIITGAMLAIARVAGETAPLLLTTFLAQDVNFNAFDGSQTALPTFIWDQISRGTAPAIDRAWGGAYALILFVLILYAAARVIAAVFAPARE